MVGSLSSTRVVVRKHGKPSCLVFETADVAPPGPGQVRVRHSAIGVNFIDTVHRSGAYPLATPHGIGMEAAGVVDALGEDVEGLELGDRVAYAAGPPGSYAEARVVPADRLVPLSSNVSDEVAAAVLLKGMTTEYLIRRCVPITAGMTVLWHAAAGGVGLLACQWLASLGATVIGTVGTDQKAALAKAHGCAHPIVYTRDDFVSAVASITDGQGVPVVFDSVGAATFVRSLDCLQPRGTLVSFGNASGKPPPLDLGVLAAKGSLFVTRPTLMSYTRSREDLLGSASAVFDALDRGVIKVAVRQRFELADARSAHEALHARMTTGSTILTVP